MPCVTNPLERVVQVWVSCSNRLRQLIRMSPQGCVRPGGLWRGTAKGGSNSQHQFTELKCTALVCTEMHWSALVCTDLHFSFLTSIELPARSCTALPWTDCTKVQLKVMATRKSYGNILFMLIYFEIFTVNTFNHKHKLGNLWTKEDTPHTYFCF